MDTNIPRMLLRDFNSGNNEHSMVGGARGGPPPAMSNAGLKRVYRELVTGAQRTLRAAQRDPAPALIEIF
jgi:hypothetical protein